MPAQATAAAAGGEDARFNMLRGSEWERGGIAATGAAGNAEPQLGRGKELRMKSNPPSWGLALPEERPAKLGLGVPGILIRSRAARFAARQ
jgi:hypothetical protein